MAGTSSAAEGSNSKAIKIGLIVVLLATAGVVYYVRTRTVGQLDTAASASPYICPVDGTVRDVTPAQFDELRRTGEIGPLEGAPPRTPGYYARCPKCGKRIMVLGARCPKDKTVFPLETKDGSPAACPKCGWKPPD
jgi:DNA-directed RNA polymerase subunit RPC12/RpoP